LSPPRLSKRAFPLRAGAPPSRPGRDGGAPARNGKARFESRGGDNRGGGRGEPRGEGRREGRGPQTFSSEQRPAPRDRQPDPNSPFAKLMALKVELERGKKES
jgi:ATP-dependent RNA helicase SUPV3L1/SUV3